MPKHMVYHETMDDANFYLQGSMIKYEGEIVQVVSVESDGSVCLITSNGSSKTVHYNDLDLSPIELGYVYDPYTKYCIFLERVPNRQWRQGLTSGSLQDKEGKHSTSNNPSSMLMRRLAKRRFPSLPRAYRLAVKDRNTIPFNKNFAVDYNGIIFYKTKMVGSYLKKKMSVSLLAPFMFLNNEVEEVLNANN